ncbi:NAD-specific glutamate dehydrogenase [compost metagenome]
MPVAIGHCNRIGRGQRFLGCTGCLQQAALGARIQVGGQARLLDDPGGDRVVEVVTTQGTVATGSHDLEDTAGQAQNGNIESTATQVVDRHHAFGVLIQAVGHGCRGRLVEQAQYVEAGQFGRILGRLALGVVEIGRHGDYRPHQFTAQGLFSSLTQGLENIGRDFHRAFRALDRVDKRHVRLAADKTVGQLLAQLFDVRQATPHQAFDRQHGVERIARGSRLGRLAHIDTIGVVAHRRWQDDLPLRVGKRLGKTTAQRSDQRIGSAKVDANRQTTLVGLRTLAGFGDLQ